MVLFLGSKNRFCYIPENESEQPVLGWNKSLSKFFLLILTISSTSSLIFTTSHIFLRWTYYHSYLCFIWCHRIYGYIFTFSLPVGIAAANDIISYSSKSMSINSIQDLSISIYLLFSCTFKYSIILWPHNCFFLFLEAIYFIY